MSDSILPKKFYMADNGKQPAKEFIDSLDKAAWAKVVVQIDRLASGNKSHGHGVGGGVSELVIDFGPGYRVYYAIVEGKTLILLLTAGNKKSQKSDIKRAREYLESYEKRKSKA